MFLTKLKTGNNGNKHPQFEHENEPISDMFSSLMKKNPIWKMADKYSQSKTVAIIWPK